MSSGYLWHMHRKFTVSHLRTFGEGKKSLELAIQQECVYLSDAFRAEKGMTEISNIHTYIHIDQYSNGYT